MVKIFIGNLSPETTREDIEELFVKYGIVTECAKYKNYAFVHMDDRKSATKAIRELHLHKLNGRPINVEPSRGKNQGPVKLHIANVEKGFDKELRDLFEEYGTVTECSIVKNFAFVHMPHYDEAMDALEGLDNLEFQGLIEEPSCDDFLKAEFQKEQEFLKRHRPNFKVLNYKLKRKRIHVQVSKSRPRGGPEEEEEEYPPPPVRGGYYPPYYPMPRPEPPYRGRLSAYPPPSPPPPPLPPPPPMRRAAYPDRGYSDRASYGSVDYYEKYRAHPFTAAASYDDRRAIPPPPPPSSALVRERLGVAPSIDPYERRALPTPAAYAARDRSPIRRIPPPPAPAAGNGYSYERSRLSPMSRAPLYAPPRTRDPYAGRVPPPLPPRYPGY